MKRTWTKRLVAVALSLAMLVTFLPEAAITANAAGKKVTATKKIKITEGMKQTISVKNLPKSATVKWKSSDSDIARVSKKGVVTGVEDGSATVKGTYKVSGKTTTIKTKVTVKTPEFKNDAYTVTSGSSITVSLKNKYKKSKYTWTSSDTAVATVNNKGLVTGVASGSAIISVKIAIPKSGLRKARTIKKSVDITVQGSHIVTTQAELDVALKKNTYSGITIKTDEKVNLSIPAGDYKSTDLIVDAPNADITNYGDFKTITIKQIATDTFVEKAKGNVLIVDAAAGRVRIPADAGVDEIKIINPNSNFLIEIEGNIKTVTVNSASTVCLNVTGSVDQVNVNGKSNITFEGSSAKNIPVNVASTADGTTVNSSIKLDITSGANTEINLSRGAEGSSVKTINTAKSVEVTNNTTSSVTVSNDAGKNQKVSPAKNATINGAGEVTGTTTPDTTSGGSGSGSTGGNSGSGSSGSESSFGGGTGGNTSASGDARPSGDLTRTVTSFAGVKAVEAGIVGTPLKSVEELMAQFPATVAGKTKKDTVTFQVTSWENTDKYDPATAQGGYYTFTAVLGEGDKPCKIKSGVVATIKVLVKPKSTGEITYESTSESLQKFSFVSDEIIDDTLALKLKYSGDGYVEGSVKVTYYNAAGYLVKTASDNGYFVKDDTLTLLFSLPRNSSGKVASFDTYTITIDAWNTYKTSIKDKISVGTPVINSDNEYMSPTISVPIENKSVTELSYGDLVIRYIKDGSVVKIVSEIIWDIPGSCTTNKELYIRIGRKDIIPDSVTVDLNYAYVASTDIEKNTDDQSIKYEGTSEELQKFSLEGSDKENDTLVLRLKYNGEGYVEGNVAVNFYNEAGNLLKTDSDSGYFTKDDTLTILAVMPKDSSGNLVSYNSYTVLVDAWDSTSYKISLKDKITLGIPTVVTDEGLSTTVTIPVTNAGTTEISGGDIIVRYYKDGSIIKVVRDGISEIPGNGTTNKIIVLLREDIDDIPDSVSVELNDAYVRKYVDDPDDRITYEGTSESLQKFAFISGDVEGNMLALKLKYGGEGYVEGNVAVNFYDETGNLMKTTSDSEFFTKDDTLTLLFDLPRDSSGNAVTYNAYTIIVDAWDTTSSRTSLKDQITIGIPAITTDDYGNTTVKVPVENASVTEITSGELVIRYIKDGEVVKISTAYIGGIPGGGTTNRRIYLSHDECDVIPDSVEVDLNYAYYSH